MDLCVREKMDLFARWRENGFVCPGEKICVCWGVGVETDGALRETYQMW